MKRRRWQLCFMTASAVEEERNPKRKRPTPEIAGMTAENMVRASLGQSMAYNGSAFGDVARRYELTLGHNGALTIFENAPKY